MRTNGPKEKAFMIKASVAIWLGIAVFLLLLLTLPRPYSYTVWAAYAILLPLGIIRINKRVAEIRSSESGT